MPGLFALVVFCVPEMRLPILLGLSSDSAMGITTILSELFSSAAFVKLNEPVIGTLPSMIMILLCAIARGQKTTEYRSAESEYWREWLTVFALKDVIKEGERWKQNKRAQEQRDDKQTQRCGRGGTITDGDVGRDQMRILRPAPADQDQRDFGNRCHPRERVHSISDLGAPEGVAYAPELNRLFIANDKRGLRNIYDAKAWQLVDTVERHELQRQRREALELMSAGGGAAPGESQGQGGPG